MGLPVAVERLLANRARIEVVPSMYGGLGLELARARAVRRGARPPPPGHERRAGAASIPVLIASADATPRQVRRLLAAGAAAYVTKPLDVQHFVGLLDRHLPTRV